MCLGLGIAECACRDAEDEMDTGYRVERDGEMPQSLYCERHGHDENMEDANERTIYTCRHCGRIVSENTYMATLREDPYMQEYTDLHGGY